MAFDVSNAACNCHKRILLRFRNQPKLFHQKNSKKKRHPASTSPLDASLALRAAFKSSSFLSKDSFVSCGRRFHQRSRQEATKSQLLREMVTVDGPYLELCLQRDLGHFQVQRLSLTLCRRNWRTKTRNFLAKISKNPIISMR